MKGTRDAAGPERLRRRVERFERYCAEKGLAITHQRSVIYRAIAASEEHPTPEMVYEEVRREIPSVSLATVYKNIKTFVDAGILREIAMPHQSVRLDPNSERHHHLVCASCKSIVDLHDGDVAPVELKRRPAGFRVDGYNVEISGLCAACAKARQKSES